MALKEKEDKAKELVKSVIITENDPNNEFYENFNEFLKMNINIIEEELVCEQTIDDQTSTHYDRNLPDKKQSTPREVSEKSLDFNDQENQSVEELFIDKQTPIILNTMKIAKRDKNWHSNKDSESDENKNQNDTIAVMKEIVNIQAEDNTKASLDNKNNSTNTNLNSSNTTDKEKEVPLFTDQERIEIGSILSHYERETELEDTFSIPLKHQNLAKNPIRNIIPVTKEIKSKQPNTKTSKIASKNS